jgi:hypothetical protein
LCDRVDGGRRGAHEADAVGIEDRAQRKEISSALRLPNGSQISDGLNTKRSAPTRP